MLVYCTKLPCCLLMLETASFHSYVGGQCTAHHAYYSNKTSPLFSKCQLCSTLERKFNYHQLNYEHKKPSKSEVADSLFTA